MSIGRQRVIRAAAVAWILFVFLLFEPALQEFPYGKWQGFLLFGPGPIAAYLGARWIRDGYELDEKAGKRISRALFRSIATRVTLDSGCKCKIGKYDPVLRVHEIVLRRGRQEGKILLSQELVKDFSRDQIIQRLTASDVQVELQDISRKRIAITPTRVIVFPWR